MGELSQVTGVPVATLKYYLREGLLHAGEATAVNQADYDDTHVKRVKLVWGLLQLGRLSIADARQVIAAVDDESMSIHDAFGVAQDAMVPSRERDDERYAAAMVEVDRFVRRHGLRVRPDAAVRLMLADALVGLDECGLLPEGLEVDASMFDDLVGPLVALAAAEVGTTPMDASRAEQVEHTVVGTIVFEVAYAALRRMALEHASAALFPASKRRRQERPRQ
ncbi:MAG: MerR family transcriptional regulator [Ilumatobacteraceae bacterium]